MRWMWETTTTVVCCVFSSHSIWTSSSLDVPAGVTQEEGHTGFFIYLPSAVRALILSREKNSAIRFPRHPWSWILCANDLIILYSLGFFFFFCSEKNPVYPISCPLPPKPAFGVWVWECLSGGCRTGITLKRCSQLAAFAIQPVGWDTAAVWLAEDGVPRCAPLPSPNLVPFGRVAARER